MEYRTYGKLNLTSLVMPKKKSKKKAARDKAEKLAKLYVKLRDDYTCQMCGKRVEGVNCHASHVIPVSRSGRLRCDPLNMKVLCYYHHLNWWHKEPTSAGKWFTDKFPERMDYLRETYLETQGLGSIKASWYEDQIVYLKAAITELTNQT
jgi:hypothetical protein